MQRQPQPKETITLELTVTEQDQLSDRILASIEETERQRVEAAKPKQPEPVPVAEMGKVGQLIKASDIAEARTMQAAFESYMEYMSYGDSRYSRYEPQGCHIGPFAGGYCVECGLPQRKGSF